MSVPRVWSEPVPILSSDDSLSLWVGRVARTHALLEYNVDNVYRFLAMRLNHEPGGKSVRGFDQLANESIRLLKLSGADRDVVEAGTESLVAAKDATAVRNRVVHDMWLPYGADLEHDEARWSAFSRSGDLQVSYRQARTEGLSMVIDAHAALVRARVRVSGLFMALHSIWPKDRTSPHGSHLDQDLIRYIALMTGRFIRQPNGDIRT